MFYLVKQKSDIINELVNTLVGYYRNIPIAFFQHYFQSGPAVNYVTGSGGSVLKIEWTNQHGCGGNEDTDPQKQNCNMVLQFMCEDAISDIPGIKAAMLHDLPFDIKNYETGLQDSLKYAL